MKAAVSSFCTLCYSNKAGSGEPVITSAQAHNFSYCNFISLQFIPPEDTVILNGAFIKKILRCFWF